MTRERFWKKSYGQDIPDLDPQMFETDAVSLFEKSIKNNLDITALNFSGVEIPYSLLDEYANRFAHMLLLNGFEKGDLIGINLPNIPEYTIAWLGALKAGCVSSGISPLLSPAEMEHQLRDSKARGLVTLDIFFEQRVVEMASRLPDLSLVIPANVGGFLPKIKQILGKLLKKLPVGKISPISGKTILRFSEIIKSSAYKSQSPQIKIGPDDTAFIMYTGGTTGLPKGAVLTHRNYVAEIMVATRYMGWDRMRGPVISAFPMFHIAGLTFNSVSVYNGWTQLLLPDPRNTDFICNMMARYKPFLICNVPSLYYLLMANPKFRRLDHSRIRQCISAAAPFPVESQQELESILGRGKLIELYGMTETTAIAVMNPALGRKKLGTVGLPLINTDIRIVDPGLLEEVEIGQPGELWLKSPMVMKEYFNNPEETGKTLDRDGYMHTGDVVVQDEEGYLRLVDRTKDMLIVSGFKVFSKKVEDLMAGHPAVEIMAVIGVPNPERPGSEMVKAFIALDPHFEFDGDEKALKEDIISFAKTRLAPYEVPKQIEILSEMPLTSVGKLDKKQLRKAAG